MANGTPRLPGMGWAHMTAPVFWIRMPGPWCLATDALGACRLPGPKSPWNARRVVEPSGNVAAGTLVQLASNQPPVQVKQPFAACGGAVAETLNEAKARAVRELATPTPSCNHAEMFESLALATPGVPLARAHAISDYHPAMHCIPVSGSTTVVVLPPCPEERPEPTAALLTTVQRYLERRRVLTSEIHVVGPHYTTVAVSARLRARPEVDRRCAVRRHGARSNNGFTH